MLGGTQDALPHLRDTNAIGAASIPIPPTWVARFPTKGTAIAIILNPCILLVKRTLRTSPRLTPGPAFQPNLRHRP